jgi:hypothetical protein
MSDARLRRVQKEILGLFHDFSQRIAPLTIECLFYSSPFADCKNDKVSKIAIELIDDSPFHLKGSFDGPEDTPYEGGRYEVVSKFNLVLVRASAKMICLL